MKRLMALFGLAVPVFAQYAGPAILSRGEAPSSMSAPDISFRPFVEVSGVYSTGLAGVSVDTSGNPTQEVSAGMSVGWGVSGSHRWRHTLLGLSYRGDYNHYFGHGGFDNTDHSLLLGITHQLSRRVTVSWNNVLGIINRDYGLLSSLSQAVPFDPSQSYIPNQDFFNDRTIYYSTGVNLTYQKSMRLSFSFGGGLSTTLRDSRALYNALGTYGYADGQYRISRRSTIGAMYSYSHYNFSQIISNTDVHTVAATYAYRISRFWEFSGYAGASRAESKFVQDVPVDPAIAAIIGITESPEVVYTVRYVPSFGARVSRTFHKGVFSAMVAQGIDPGNGLFLTSEATTVSAGYTYTGLRKWSFGVNATDMMSKSIGNVNGKYDSQSVNAEMSRQLSHHFHFVTGVTSFRYSSPDFSKYNQWFYSAHAGFGWTPGDVPLRIW